MIYRKLLAIFTFCLMINNGAVAESEWRFSIGVNHRTFDDIEFEQLRFNNPKYPGLPYVNGTLNAALDTATVEDGAAQAPGLFTSNPNTAIAFPDTTPANGLIDIPAETGFVPTVTLDSIIFSGASEEFDDGSGVVLQASKTLQDNSNYTWDLDLSLTTAFSDTDEMYNGSVTANSTVLTGTAFLNVGTNGDATITGTNATAAANLGAATITTGTVAYDLDLAVYTIGAGISGNFKKGNFGFNLGVGPSITLADLDVDAQQRANFTQRFNDDATDLLLGVYVNVGLNYSINESVAVGVEYRFDQLFDEVSTDLADVDLDGASTQIKVTFSF